MASSQCFHHLTHSFWEFNVLSSHFMVCGAFVNNYLGKMPGIQQIDIQLNTCGNDLGHFHYFLSQYLNYIQVSQGILYSGARGLWIKNVSNK